MLIYTIIVTYNGKKWIDFCLGSLRQSTIQSIPIIIDNCSTDDTVLYVKRNYPEAIVCEQNKNLGFGQANNIGLRYALEHNAEYILLLNQDAAIAPNMLDLCIKQSDGKSLLSPIHMNGKGTGVDKSFRESPLLKCTALINDTFANTLKQYYICDEICAACWLLPASVVKQIGGFNPLFFHYGEDNNYYHRLVYHKIQNRIIPQARMYHDREEHGNMQVYNQRYLENCLMLCATNINLSCSERILQYLKLLITCYFQLLPQKQYKIGTYLVQVLKLICRSKLIKDSRKTEVLLTTNHL